jgi:flagellar FliJ protein
MMYKFRLERVLEYRRTCEDNIQQEMRQQQHLHQQEMERLEGLQRARQAQQEALEASEGLTLRGDELRLWRDYHQTLSRRCEAQKGVVTTADQALEGKRQELLVARQATKVIEKVGEKDKTRYAHEQARREAQFFDEIALKRSRYGY